MFIPGETISFEFQLPFEKNDIQKVILTYRQRDHIVLVKTIYPGQIVNEVHGSHFVVTLTQEESLLFKDDDYFYVQINVTFIAPDGNTRCTSYELRGENKLQHYREVVT